MTSGGKELRQDLKPWCTFWQASDVSEESQAPVTDDCTYVWQTCLFGN